MGGIFHGSYVLKRHGFTLIELLIVVAVIAILAAIALPNFLEAQTRSKTSRVMADMRSIATGLEAYAVDFNHYPPNLMDAAGRHNVMRMMMGHMPFVPYTLTTPVAYMSDLPLDTFKPRIMKDHEHCFMYFNSTNTPDHENRAAYRALVESRPATAEVNPPAWFMASTGPDYHMGTVATLIEMRGDLPIYQIQLMPMMPQLGERVQYDPTNGTVSEGDIVRFGP
jgi:prepilin-type N-terminal cleavage/methylation domain-containing protein